MKLALAILLLAAALHACSGQTTGTVTWHAVQNNDCAYTCQRAGKTAPINGGSANQATCSFGGKAGMKETTGCVVYGSCTYYRSGFYCACRTGVASWKTLAACTLARRSASVTNGGYTVCRMYISGRYYVGYLSGLYCYVPSGGSCKGVYFFNAEVLCVGA